MTQLEIKREAVRRPFGRRRKSCPFSGPNAQTIDYKDTKLLARYTSERGKIVPSPHFRRFGEKSNVNWPLPSSARAFWH